MIYDPLTLSRRALLAGLASSVAACGRRTPPDDFRISPDGTVSSLQGDPNGDYGVLPDGEYTLPAVPARYIQGVNRRALVPYTGDLNVGDIEVDPHAKFVYWIMDGRQAWRYPIAVGREGLGMSGTTIIKRKAEWPGWTPTANMLRREPEVYEQFRDGIPGGLSSPLGARALYLFRGGRDTYYRIHGTNDLGSIGNSGSAGCIRMFNHDAIDLFDRVPLQTKVVVRTYSDSVRLEGEGLANRGVELPPVILSRDELGLD